MAIFEKEYTISLLESGGNKILPDPKDLTNTEFRNDQCKKVIKIIDSIISSEAFAKENLVKPEKVDYDYDDDFRYVFGDWLRRKKYVIDLYNFKKEDIESGKAKESCDFIVKKFKEARNSDNKLFGTIKIDDDMNIIYRL